MFSVAYRVLLIQLEVYLRCLNILVFSAFCNLLLNIFIVRDYRFDVLLVLFLSSFINALTKTSKKTYTNIHRQEYTQTKNAHKAQLTKKTQKHIYTNKYMYAFQVINSVVYSVRYKGDFFK